MRENPWHLRTPTTEHYQWFRNLVDLHRLTEAWLTASLKENLVEEIGSHLGRKVQENLWMLRDLSDPAKNKNIENFLDDTPPEDMLGRLEHVVWAIQAGALSSILTQSNSLEKTLEQSAWSLGKSCVETRWRPLVSGDPLSLNEILFALHDTPFSGYPNNNGFLIRRAVSSSIEIELKSCPHLTYYTEVHSVADSLCNFHTHWMKGFASGLNSQIQVDRHQLSQRCLQRWYLI